MRYESELRRLAERQHALVSRPQMRRIGLRSNDVAGLIRSGRWEHAGGRVLRLVGAPRSAGQRMLMPVLDQGVGAALGHLCAGAWWGLSGCRAYPVTIVTASSSSRRTELGVVRRVHRLDERWIVTLRDVPVVRPELLAVHLFADCSFGRAERLVDRLWSMRLLSGPSLEVMLADLGRSGRNGIVGVRQFLEQRGPDYVPPASGLESRALTILRQAGIDLRCQVDSGGDGWTGRVDFRHPELPVIVEVQSEAFHTALCDATADRMRLQRLRDDGFVVVEVTDGEVFSQPQVVVQRVAGAIAAVRSTPVSGGFVARDEQ